LGGRLWGVLVGGGGGLDRAIEEVELHGAPFPGRALWSFLIRWVCPVAIAVIIVYTIASM